MRRKQLSHAAYERIRNPRTPDAELDELEDFQRKVCAKIPIPPGARTSNTISHEGNAMAEEITYYALVDDYSSREQSPAELLRRIKHEGGQRDEAFTA